MKISFSILLLLLINVCSIAQVQREGIPSEFRNGITVDQFIYEDAPFPQCHASTIVETPAGLVSAWFGGTREGNKDVSIYVSRMINGKWDTPTMAAEGIIDEQTRYACYFLIRLINGSGILHRTMNAK